MKTKIVEKVNLNLNTKGTEGTAICWRWCGYMGKNNGTRYWHGGKIELF